MHDQVNKSNQGVAEVAIIAGVALVAALGLGLYATSLENGMNTIPEMTSPMPTDTADMTATAEPIVSPDTSSGLTISQVLDNPSQFMRQTITLEGEVDTMHTSRVFVLDQEGTILGDEILVVLARTPLPSPDRDTDFDLFEDTNDVRVVGEIMEMDADMLRQDYEIDLDQSVLDDYENEVIMIATQVRRINLD